MIKINEDQMDVFGSIQYSNLKSEIEKDLTSNIPEWDGITLSQKTHWIEFLIRKGNYAKLSLNSEYIQFARICMSSKKGCQPFLKRDDVNNILLDQYLSTAIKLSLLSDIENTSNK